MMPSFWHLVQIPKICMVYFQSTDASNNLELCEMENQVPQEVVAAWLGSGEAAIKIGLTIGDAPT